MKLNEEILIQKVREKDNRALEQLYQKYLPLVNQLKARYYLRDFDADDWEQEALLVCYETAILWHPGGRSFGSFYKLRLLNHAKTLIRYQTAKRRAAFTHAASYDLIIENGVQLDPLTSFSKVPASESWEKLLARLSQLELLALQESLGLIDQERLLQLGQLNEASLARARSRVVRKLKDVLF